MSTRLEALAVRLNSPGARRAIADQILDARERDRQASAVLAVAAAAVEIARAAEIVWRDPHERVSSEVDYANRVRMLWVHPSRNLGGLPDLGVAVVTLLSFTMTVPPSRIRRSDLQHVGQWLLTSWSGAEEYLELAQLVRGSSAHVALTFPLRRADRLRRWLARIPLSKAMSLPPAGLPAATARELRADVGLRGAEVDFLGGERDWLAHSADGIWDPGLIESPRASRYRVWFGTDREPAHARAGYFSNERDSEARLHLGWADVLVPKSHRFGETGRAWYRRWPREWFDDDHLRVLGATELDRDAFVGQLQAALASEDLNDRTILLYVHGYNADFEGSVIRAAQLGFDLKVPGAMALFSWPSRGTTEGYNADEATVETSESRFINFVRLLAEEAGAERVHVIAHSMGNRLLARTAEAVRAAGVTLGQIILAAPDVDAQLFRHLAATYPLISTATTMYVSAKDRALGMSKFLHTYDRAGYTPPVTLVPGIDTVEVTDIDLTVIGHGYYAEAEPVLYDIRTCLDGQNDPGKRIRLQPSGDGHWVLVR